MCFRSWCDHDVNSARALQTLCPWPSTHFATNPPDTLPLALMTLRHFAPDTLCPWHSWHFAKTTPDTLPRPSGQGYTRLSSGTCLIIAQTLQTLCHWPSKHFATYPPDTLPLTLLTLRHFDPDTPDTPDTLPLTLKTLCRWRSKHFAPDIQGNGKGLNNTCHYVNEPNE